MSVVDNEAVRQLIALARLEDYGDADRSSSLLPDPAEAAGFHVIARQRCTFAGKEIAATVLNAYDPSIKLDWAAEANDGARIDAPPDESTFQTCQSTG